MKLLQTLIVKDNNIKVQVHLGVFLEEKQIDS